MPASVSTGEDARGRPLRDASTYEGDAACASRTSSALYRYDAFGRPTETTSAGTPSIPATLAAAICARNVLRDAGHCFDEHSGLYYCPQRYHDAGIRQFVSKHPARSDGEESAYQYCGGDPVGKVDPSGEFNVSAAITYARKWAYDRDPAYPAYRKDCTNFVSQLLIAGGHRMSIRGLGHS